MMKTIQIVLDEKLLRATNAEARKRRINRSAYVRAALLENLRQAHFKEMEERERKGYEAHPETEDDWKLWEREAVWPEK